jgi:hypothetical protein
MGAGTCRDDAREEADTQHEDGVGEEHRDVRERETTRESSGRHDHATAACAAVPIVAIIMTTVGLLAALGPARRGLAVQPTEALRSD